MLRAVEALASKPAVVLLDQVSIQELARYLHQSLAIPDIYSIGYQPQVFGAIEAHAQPLCFRLCSRANWSKSA